MDIALAAVESSDGSIVTLFATNPTPGRLRRLLDCVGRAIRLRNAAVADDGFGFSASSAGAEPDATPDEGPSGCALDSCIENWYWQRIRSRTTVSHYRTIIQLDFYLIHAKQTNQVPR